MSAGTVNSWIFPNVFEIEKQYLYGIAWFDGANLLGQTIFFLHYYYKRCDGQVLFYKSAEINHPHSCQSNQF